MASEKTDGQCIYRFHQWFGRQGDLDGVFLARPEEVAAAMGRRAYFGEVLGKHSDVWCDVTADNVTMASDNPEAVRVVAELGLESGHNPLDYLDPEADEARAEADAMEAAEKRAQEIAARAIEAAGLDVDPVWLLVHIREEAKRGRNRLLLGKTSDSGSYHVAIAVLGAGDQSTYYPASIEHSTRGTLWRYGTQEAAR